LIGRVSGQGDRAFVRLDAEPFRHRRAGGAARREQRKTGYNRSSIDLVHRVAANDAW
jgi:hypothetical protein